MFTTFPVLQTLAGNTAKMAQQMMVLDKTEASLDREIQHEAERGEPTTKVQRVRRKGEKALHTKYVLLAVVILNIIDCLLVLGELMLDIKYVTVLHKKVTKHTRTSRILVLYSLLTSFNDTVLISDLLTKEYDRSEKFIGEMKLLYPARLGRLEDDDIVGLQHQILIGHTVWDSAINSSSHSAERHTRRRRTGVTAEHPTGSGVGNETLITHVHHAHSIEEQIAHGLHKASISILGILCVEILVKIVCLGKELLHHKLECFDAFVVIASFVVDLVFLGGLQDFEVQEFVLILAFMVPWRIIRVVNSLVVAIMDHEHLRLVILYKQKKKTAKELQEVKDENKGLEACISELGKLCESAGIPDTHVKAKLNMYRKVKAKTNMMGAMSSFAIGGDAMNNPFKVGLPKSNGNVTINVENEQNHTASTTAENLEDVTTIANETSKTANATGSNLTNSASPRLPRGLLDDRPRMLHPAGLSVIEVREMDEKPRRNSFLAELAENSAAFMATISDDTETHSHPPVRGEEAEVGITKLGVTEDRGETLTDDSFNSK
ncbi:HVCN1-like protein, partial [Mya arenaria]